MAGQQLTSKYSDPVYKIVCLEIPHLLPHKLKQRLNKWLLKHKRFLLQHVDIAHWAGLGGVRYIPVDYVDKDSEKVLEMTEDDLKMVNQRNMELVATLRNTDSAFSLGEGPPPEHVMCVR